MHLREAFHGRTGYTLSLTNTADPRRRSTSRNSTGRASTIRRFSFPATASSLADAERREKAALDQAKQFLAERKDDIAAFIMEPIQGEGGDNHFRPEFFRAVRQLCDENEMLLIFDEVQTGVGLTGKMWGFQNYGVEPGHLRIRQEDAGVRLRLERPHLRHRRERLHGGIAHQLDVGRQPHRHGPRAAVLRSDRRGEARRECREGRRVLCRRAAALRNEFPKLVSNVRGRGLMAAFDLPSADLRDAAIKALMQNDVMVLASGQRSMRFRPALNLSMDEAGEAIRRMEKALQQLARLSSRRARRRLQVRRPRRRRPALAEQPASAAASNTILECRFHERAVDAA